MFVKQWVEKTIKLNFFSMYFVRTSEEIHLSFKNSEKERTQALSKKSQTFGVCMYQFAAAQQTSTAKLSAFFQRFETKQGIQGANFSEKIVALFPML